MGEKIKHHSGFYSGLELLLWPYREHIQMEEEKPLFTGGVRVDALILKKDSGVDIAFDIARMFKGHNIIEYKRPDDDLDIDVFAKVVNGYAGLYKSLGLTVDAIPFEDLTATIYRHAKLEAVFKKLEAYGAKIESKYPGVYYVRGAAFFDVQILVGRELDPKEYCMFKALVPGASVEDIKAFDEMAGRNDDPAFQRSVENVRRVSVSGNEETYAKLMEEDSTMYEKIKEVMKKDLEKARDDGVNEGDRLRMIDAAKGMYVEGLKTEVIARILKVPEDEVREILGLQAV